MDAILLKQPYTISFSGNPMPVSFAITPYGALEKTQDIRLVVRILIETFFFNNSFVQVKSQSFYPDSNGKIEFDIKSIINPNLDYYTPKSGLKNAVLAQGQVKRYKIEYLLQKDEVLIGTVQTSDILFAVKGGMAYDKWHPYEFFTDVIINQKNPLQFAPVQKVFMDELRFFYWLYPFGDLKPQKISIDIQQEDNSIITVTLPNTITANQWGVCCMPIGFNQLNLASYLDPGLLAVSFTVRIDNTDNTNIVAPFTFFIDHRNFYNPHTLLYRNSSGGLETIRLRGQVDFEADYNRQLAQVTVPPAYFANSVLMAQQSDNNADEQAKFKGDTGFANQQGTESFRDFFLSSQRFHFHQGKLLPVTIITKNTKFYANRDYLISTVIEWQHAYFNQFYTPKSLMPVGRSCPAVETFIVKQLTKTTMQIMYSLPIPYSRAKIEIITSGGTQVFYFTGNSNSLVQTFTNPISVGTEDITVKCYCVCDEDTVPMDLGPASVFLLTIFANLPPVANDDTYNIAAGYNTAVALSPAALDNDYDPDGDAIEIQAVVGGATAQGGTYDINAAGEISYTPPDSLFNGQDSFDYVVWETANHAAFDTGTVYINVGVGAGAIYAKLVLRNVVYTEIDLNSGSTNAEIWIDFFSDLSASNPFDVSGMGIIANVDEEVYNMFNTGSFTDTHTTNMYACNGTSQLIFNAEIAHQYYHDYGSTGLYTEVFQLTDKLLAGLGYIVI